MPVMTASNVQCGYYESPIGLIELRGNERGLFSLRFCDDQKQLDSPVSLLPYIQTLEAYFSKQSQSFADLALMLQATEFQLKVWEHLSTIAYGDTTTYGAIAKAIGHEGAVRAVGTAVGRNPLPVIIPCHRVLPRSGGIGEFSCGVWRKQWLLKHEGVIA